MSKKILIITILLVAIILSQLSTIIYAATIDTSKTANLTIIEYENAYGKDKNANQNVPLSGVSITIYKLNEASFNNTASKIESDLKNGVINLPSQTLTTGSNGTVTFSNLQLGRYLVVQSNSPANVNVKMESFLVDLPRTSDDGTSWNYDVTVEPKNITIYGDVELDKTTNLGNALQDTTWELQEKGEDNNWTKYNYSGTLTTNKDGKILLENLPAGNYRLVETSTVAGYILDQQNYKEFTISKDKTSIILECINEKPSIQKQVKISDGYGSAVGAYSKDSVEWKVTADVPSIINKMNTYFITETLPNQLDYVPNSLNVFGENNTLLTLNTDYTLTTENKTLKIQFTPNKLSSFNSIYFTYQTNFNQSVEYGKSILNNSTLTYTNKIDIEGNCVSAITTNPVSAEVHTGALAILKTDINDIPLQGAKFKISASKKDAQDKKYIKDKDGNDIVAVSNSNGIAKFYGLKYGNDNILANSASSQYFVTEIESPTYKENDEIKHYNLLADSVEVTVNTFSGDETKNPSQIINKKGFILPVTGVAGTVSLIALGSIIVFVSVKRIKKHDEK